jgi:hypothetical protein
MGAKSSLSRESVPSRKGSSNLGMKRPPLILSGGAKYGITRNYHLIIQSAVIIPMAPYLEQLIVC